MMMMMNWVGGGGGGGGGKRYKLSIHNMAMLFVPFRKEVLQYSS